MIHDIPVGCAVPVSPYELDEASRHARGCELDGADTMGNIGARPAPAHSKPTAASPRHVRHINATNSRILGTQNRSRARRFFDILGTPS